ncbi:Nonsense-mediated mRNA decay protein 5, partial [Dimargaris verticillata]
MNAATLYQLFSTSFSPDQQARKEAERQLKEVDDAPEFIPQVLHILGAGESEIPVKQAAAIYLKNKIRSSWDPSPHSPIQVINDAVKATVRESLLVLMAHTQPAIRTQLVDCLRPILAVDFPEKWPTYLPQTREFLQSKDTTVVHTGLLALFIVIRFYQYKSGASERAHLEEIIAVCFPLLLAIGDTLLGMSGDESAQMLKLVFRCYYTAIQTELSPVLQEQSVLVAWGTLLLKALKRPLSANVGVSTDEVARDEDWKARKWAMRCLNRLFSGYGNPALLPSSQRHYLPFANYFIEHFAPEIAQTYFELIERYVSHQVVFSPKCLCLLATFLSDAIKHKGTWKLVKPHVESLVQHFIFPQLMYTTEDEELWEDNPVDYVHKRMDPLDDFDSPMVSATNLLLDLATDRRKHCFQIILNLINSVAVAYAQQADPAARDPHQKDGVLNMLGAMAQIVLHKKSPVRNNMEEFMAVHVFPEFTSANPLLRLRALAFYCQFCDLELSNAQHLQFVYEHTLQLLQDPQIPIRVQAALTLQPLVQHEQVRNAIVPNLPQIMQQFLDLTNQLDIDTLSTVMEEFVETFSDHMAPIAAQLCGQLSETYLRIMREAVGTGADPQANIDYGSL